MIIVPWWTLLICGFGGAAIGVIAIALAVAAGMAERVIEQNKSNKKETEYDYCEEPRPSASGGRGLR